MKLITLSVVAIGLLLMASTVLAGAGNRAERAEVRFLEGMMDHHQMAVDMANDCLKKAADQTLLTLCQNIITAQTAEITQMQSWVKDWYEVDYAPEPMQMNSMPGMVMPDPTMSMSMMAGLNALTGHDYEVAWVESMIDHHDDALHMADRLLKQVEHVELRDMATTIIKDQSAEIRMMEALLDTWAA
ncbi:MAG: DUF305 domain-containing protein [Chloroflexota bacterium]